MTPLLDGNVLIALMVEEHVHHAAADSWLSGGIERFASCPITQGSLVRLLVREGGSAQRAHEVVSGLAADPRHEFWPDDIPYGRISFGGVVGHRQVTDAYLVELAHAHGGHLATFDRGLAKLHADRVELIATGSPRQSPG